MLKARTRRVVRQCFYSTLVLSLGGAGLTGLFFEHVPMDMVLLQLVFYGAWWCLLGARVGGYAGAAMEEDCCGDLDMGVLSSMGSLIGTLSLGLVGCAVTGLGLLHSWKVVWLAAALLTLVYGLVEWKATIRIVRLPDLDERGKRLDAEGRPLPDEEQPLMMRDRLTMLIAVGFVLVLLVTFAMAWIMGKDLGHPVMMAPMMYGMFGTMLGGMLGGWLAGLLDEHAGHPDHDNPVMIGAMALMAGMMGGMPSGMIGGMMAVMGDDAILLTISAGIFLLVLSWWWVVGGRYRIVLVRGQVEQRSPLYSTSAASREAACCEPNQAETRT